MKFKTQKYHIMSNPQSIVCSVALLVAAHSAMSSSIEISPAPYTNGATFEYLCTDQSLTASVTGLNTSLPSERCCDSSGDGTWSLTETTYSWSGDVSGANSTSAISNSAGSKSASVAVKHKFTCSKGGDKERTDSPGSRSVTVMTNDTTTHTPPAANAPNSPSARADQAFKGNSTITNMGVTIRYTYNGTLTQNKSSETYPKEGGAVTPQPCGQGTSLLQGASSGWKIAGSTTIPRTPIKVAGTIWSGTTSLTKVYDIPGMSFRKHFIQIHKQLFTFVSGEWGADSTVFVEQIGGPGISLYPFTEQIGGDAANPNDYSESSTILFGKDAPVECCPNA